MQGSINGTSGAAVPSNSSNPTTNSSNSTSGGSGSNFAGSNLYYAAGLSADQRKEYLSALKEANMKVLRVGSMGTTIQSYPSLESEAIGTYDVTVLELYDDFMIDAHDAGIKLMISFHSFNALQGGDIYGSTYGTSGFYTSSEAQKQFDARIQHVMGHKHKSLGKKWSELSDYIFAFETQNEAMIGLGQNFIESHQSWQCDRAKTIKSALNGNTGILVTTGGESWMDESGQPDWFNCDSLDIIAIHGYGTSDFDQSKIENYVEKAKAASKKIIFQEWGACYYTTENNNCPQGDRLGSNTRNSNIEKWASAITSAGVPWLYWQAIPNADPHYGYDFEIGIVDDESWDTLKRVAQEASQATGAFDFSNYLL